MRRKSLAAWRLLTALWLWLQVGCAPDTIVPITQVMVVVHSDLAPETQLRQISVEVQDEAGMRTRDQRSFNLAARSGEPGTQTLPLSFSVVEALENPAPRFRLVVTGWGRPGPDGNAVKLVRQTSIAAFQPGVTSRLVVYLGSACLQSSCDERRDLTCYATPSAGIGAGQCGAVVVQEMLPPVKPGSESRGLAWPPQAEAGSALGGVEAGARSDPSSLSDAAVRSDASGAAELGMDAASMSDARASMEASVASDAGAEPAETGVKSDAGTGRGPCLEGITDYTKQGPFSFSSKTTGSVKFWVPAVPSGCKVPVVHFANGTGAACSTYQGLLEHLASHGFLAACFENPNTGSGAEGLMAFETALQSYPELADRKLGSTGHNQGGQGAIATLQLAEDKWGGAMTYAGLAIEPASGFGTQPAGGMWKDVYAKVESPLFLLSGGMDTLISEAWVQQAYDALPTSSEAYLWSAIQAAHVPPPIDESKQVSVPWFRWKLLGDAAACRYFKSLPDGVTWERKLSRNERACP